MRRPAARVGETVARVEDDSCLGFHYLATKGVDAAVKAWEIRRGRYNPNRARQAMGAQIVKAIKVREVKAKEPKPPKDPAIERMNRSEAAKRRWATIPKEQRTSPFKLPDEERIRRRKESVKRAKQKHYAKHGPPVRTPQQMAMNNVYRQNWLNSLTPEKRAEYHEAQKQSKARWRQKQREKRIASLAAA